MDEDFGIDKRYLFLFVFINFFVDLPSPFHTDIVVQIIFFTQYMLLHLIKLIIH